MIEEKFLGTLTIESIMGDLMRTSTANISTLDDIDDDMFEAPLGSTSIEDCYRELPQNNFNIRTLTQDKIEELKINSNFTVIRRM